MTTYKDMHHRSILKALSWRVCATVTTMVIFYVLTGRLVLALGAGAIEVVVKLLLYYLHERVWGLLGIGRKEHPLSSLPIRKALDEDDLETIKNKLRELGYIGED
jgi:adenylylsulfate kinase